jgi:MFS family permease
MSRSSTAYSPFRRFLAMLTLVTAGEAAFFLPYVLVRIFRPTILDVFDINNFELGTAFSVYGVVAMGAYFAGGPLADRFQTRWLLPTALLTTGLGGFFMATLPDLLGLKLLYGYWGLTSILLFWAALLKATRAWGGQQATGQAFGWLDGGRGAIAASIGSLGVWIFAAVLPEDSEAATLAERQEALKQVIGMVSGFVSVVGVLTFFALPRDLEPRPPQARKLSLQGVKQVLVLPTVWLQALIIICAYVGYKGTDDFSLYARDVMGFGEVKSARTGTISLWVRPFGAIIAGFLADRFGASRMTVVSFGLILVGSVLLASGLIRMGSFWQFYFTLIGASAGIHALRGLYFAIMAEGKVPLAYTGSAVGLVSVLGYTPDIFFGPLMGWLLDRSPGATGHQHVFWVVAGFAVLGLVATGVFRRLK